MLVRLDNGKLHYCEADGGPSLCGVRRPAAFDSGPFYQWPTCQHCSEALQMSVDAPTSRIGPKV